MTPGLRHFIHNAHWFDGRGREFTLSGVRRVGSLPLPEEGPVVVVDLVEVSYPEGDTELYQLPLSFRDEQDERLGHAFIGTWDDPDHGRSHVYDAVHDSEAMSQFLAAFAGTTETDEPVTPLGFHRLPGHQLDTSARAALFPGKQSNSLVAFGEDSMFKVFRRVAPGPNPDVEVHRALTEAESGHVAALLGWLDVADEASGEVIQLAMLQQFLRTASDGWELAQGSVRNLYSEGDLHADEVGGDFAAESHRLGGALAEVHRVLAEAFPVETRDASATAELAEMMTTHLARAVEVVPELVEHRAGLEAIFAAVAKLDSIRLQRVHCDLHLGQTLRTVRGWKFIDFEGEAEKPLTERVLPDAVWADVASMLRSYDYAANVVARVFTASDDATSAQRLYRGWEWAERNRGAFLAAYAPGGPTADEQVLLDAYEAHRAVIECVHEVEHRPTWLPIPLSGIERLVTDRS